MKMLVKITGRSVFEQHWAMLTDLFKKTDGGLEYEEKGGAGGL